MTPSDKLDKLQEENVSNYIGDLKHNRIHIEGRFDLETLQKIIEIMKEARL